VSEANEGFTIKAIKTGQKQDLRDIIIIRTHYNIVDLVKKEYNMKCPNCGYDQHCGCDACKDRLPKGMKGWITDKLKDTIKCANCELTAHPDWWNRLEWDVFVLSGERNKQLQKENKTKYVNKYLTKATIKAEQEQILRNLFSY